MTHEWIYTGSQEAVQWYLLSGAKGFWNLGWSLVTNEGLYRLSGCCLMVFESEWYYYY